MKRRIYTGVAALAAAFLLVVGGGAAHAVLTGHSGTALSGFRALAETNAWSVAPAAGTWVNVPGASISIAVPAGTTRVHQASFTAESQCSGGTVNSWCSVRIIRISPSGLAVELNPQSSTDFAFDSSGGDTWQAGAINRSGGRVAAGTYRFVVQATVVNGATTIRLDDWNFQLHQIT